MGFVFWATTLLLLSTATYYLVFAMLVYYWHEKEFSVLVVPLLFTFEFFLAGFLLMALAAMLLAYLPDLPRVFSSFARQP